MKCIKTLVFLFGISISFISFGGEIDKKSGGCFATINAMLEKKVQLTDNQSNFIQKFVKENRPRLISIRDKVAVCGVNLTKNCVTKYISANDFDFLSEFLSETGMLRNNFYATDPRAPSIPYYSVAYGANCLAFVDKFK